MEAEIIVTDKVKKDIIVNIKKLHPKAIIPTYAYEGDMGMDITAVDVVYDKERDCFVYHTGLAFEVPKGYGMLLFPRSSNKNTNAYMTNHVGVLDSGYRGELLLCFKNRTDYKFLDKVNELISLYNRLAVRMHIPIKKPIGANLLAPYDVGDRIAQLVILPYPTIEFIEVEKLSETERGEGGHGSSGK